MTNTRDSVGDAATPRRLLTAVERAHALDPPAERVARPFQRLFGGKAGWALRGRELGHPLAVSLPIGARVCSALLDALPGNETAAQRLVAIGLLATPPTAVLGAADYHELEKPAQRRVGLAHPGANALAAGIFLASYVARSSSAREAGKVLSLLGLLVFSSGGALGGHLAYAQGAGVFRWQRGSTGTPR